MESKGKLKHKLLREPV